MDKFVNVGSGTNVDQSLPEGGSCVLAVLVTIEEQVNPRNQRSEQLAGVGRIRVFKRPSQVRQRRNCLLNLFELLPVGASLLSLANRSASDRPPSRGRCRRGSCCGS